MTNKALETFEKKAKSEAEEFLVNLESEIDNRFQHQENVLDNMSRFIGKFQDTLKVFGKDV